MAFDESTVLRAGGVSAFIAILGLLVSGVTIALFFGGAGAFWGPVNDLATAVTLLALLLPVIAVDRIAGADVGGWLRIVTVAAVAGLLLGAVGQLLLVAGVIDLQASFVTGGLGILPVFAWLLAVAFLALGPGILPPQLGWLAIAVIALSAGLAVAAGMPVAPAPWIVSVALLIVIAGWMGSLGMTLLERSTLA